MQRVPENIRDGLPQPGSTPREKDRYRSYIERMRALLNTQLVTLEVSAQPIFVSLMDVNYVRLVRDRTKTGGRVMLQVELEDSTRHILRPGQYLTKIIDQKFLPDPRTASERDVNGMWSTYYAEMWAIPSES